MLPPACRWIEDDAGSYLHWHARCIATVRRTGERWQTAITWTGRRHFAVAGSRVQGKRWIERWVSAQRGLPVVPKRKSTR